ncbi:MAG: 4Fe-4S dicluster domain-containing protein [Candidatus Neomarinimicrobiota bacterium]
MNYGFVIDNRLCIGCHACTVACKSEHDVAIGVNRTHVKYIEKGIFPNNTREFSVHRCNHCSNAPCVEICPTTALYNRSDGIVDFDNDRCIGCKSCMQACPYDALYIDPDTNTAAKCNYCAHRLDGGYEPACVIVCPVEAIVSGNLDNQESKISRIVSEEDTMVRKPEKNTIPNLYYVNGTKEMLNPSSTKTDLEYVWSEQSKGVGHYAKYADNRVSESDSENLLIQLAMENSSNSNTAIDQRAIDDVAKEIQNNLDSDSARRVYDSPSKGVLWGWEVAGYVWTKAIATGTLLMMALLNILGDGITKEAELHGLLLTLIFMGFTGALLVMDLDRPDRFLYVLLRPQWKSWLVRGAYIITTLGILVTLLLLEHFFVIGLNYLWTLGAIFSILGAIYTAFLFNQARARDFWQSPWTGSVHMLLHAVMAGSVVLMFIAPYTESLMISILKYSIVFNLFLILKEIFFHDDTADVNTTIKGMTKGYYSKYFWIGILIGNITPFALMHIPQFNFLFVVGSLILIGIFLTEFVRIRVPQMIPLS